LGKREFRKLFIRIAAMQRGLGRGLWDTTGERQHGQQHWRNPFHFSADSSIGSEGRATCSNTRPNHAGSLFRPISQAVSRMRRMRSKSDNLILLAGTICLS
jgi:hypothetical protein